MKNLALTLLFFASFALASCNHCSTCPMTQEGKKYRKIRNQALKQERKMNKQAKKEAKG